MCDLSKLFVVQASHADPKPTLPPELHIYPSESVHQHASSLPEFNEYVRLLAGVHGSTI
jgi:hypothetical protein